MSILSCMVVDANTKHSVLLHDFIAKTPRLNFAGRSESAQELYQQALLHKIDVIFWDFRLMDKRIICALKEAGHYPIIICLSTKEEQEENEQDIDILSFLCKPISFERFQTVMTRIKNHLSAPLAIQQSKNRRFIFIKSEYRILRVRYEDIIFCEGLKDYTQIYLKGKAEPILTLNNLKTFTGRLPSNEFIRVHRSFIISLNHIDSIVRNEIFIGKIAIPIGDSYKENFYQVIDWNS